ncbi:MAG TPA: glycosyltransferase [Candidatus Acidoferrum sp.]|nr:glycosyltransferase [Candidatus Acidoferrum sp.]
MLAYSFYETDARIKQYATALVERGDTVDVIALRQPGQRVRSVLNGVNVFRIQTRMINERGPLTYLFRILRFLLLSAALIARRHFSERYQLIHVHSVPDFLVFAAIFPKLLGTPVILDIHDVLPEFYASKFRVACSSFLFRCLVLVERLSITFADYAIVANHLWCERVAKRCGMPKKCSPIRNYPVRGLFNPNIRTRGNGKFLITYPGSLNWHQGVDVAITAFAKIKDQMPDAEFHIYGEGPAKESLIRLADSLGLGNRVVFHGLLPTEQIVQVMADTDLAVEPKRAGSQFGNEALSMKIFEFMAVGVPLVVSRTRIHQYYYSETLVKYYDSDDEAELAANMVLLRKNPALRQQQVANALKYVEAHNWDVEKYQYLGIVDSLVAKEPVLQSSPAPLEPCAFSNSKTNQG